MSKRSFSSLRVFPSKVSRTEVVVALGRVRRPTRKHLKHIERAPIVARTGVGNAEEVVHVGLGRMCLTVIFQLSDSFPDATRVEFPMPATGRVLAGQNCGHAQQEGAAKDETGKRRPNPGPISTTHEIPKAHASDPANSHNVRSMAGPTKVRSSPTIEP